MSSAWPAVVSAIAALAGVALGQWLQSHRDLAQHERAIQVETRRSLREDRTRFAEERRRAYAEFLANYDQCERALGRFERARNNGPAHIELRAEGSYSDWVTSEHEAEYESLYDELRRLHAYFELIAPDGVTQAAFDALEAWDVVGRDAMFDRKEDLQRLRDARSQLILRMKADLDAPVKPK